MQAMIAARAALSRFFPRRFPTTREAAALAVLLALLVVGCPDWVPNVIAFRSPDEFRVDTSALVRLNHLFLQGARFGVELIDPYGPLQFVTHHLYWPGLFAAKLVGRVLHAVALGLIVWQLSRATGHRSIVLAASAAILLVWAAKTGQDSVYEIVFLLLVYAKLVEPRTTAAEVVGAAAAAMLALTKFPFFILFVATLLTVATIDLVRRRVPVLALCATGFFLALWLAIGQRFLDLGPWIATSFALSSGFNEAMSMGFTEGERLVQVAVFVATMAALGSLHLALFRDKASRIISAGTLLHLGLWCFVVFKHGIVRHDAHAAHAGVSFVLAAALFALITPGTLRPPARAAVMGTLALIVIANFAVVRAHLGARVDPQHVASAWVNSAKAMGELRQTASSLASTHAQRALQFRDQVGPLPAQATVDQWPDNAAVAIFSGGQYRPRPMPFAYSVYSPAISARNAAFLAGKDAPSHILFEVATIDGRLPSNDDALSWRAILAHYDPEGMAGRRVVLKRRDEPRRMEASPAREADLKWGERVDLGSAPGEVVWASIGIEHTLLGKLVNLFYKSPPIAMAVTTRDGRSQTYRVVPAMLRSGLLLSPHVGDIGQFLDLFAPAGSSPRGSDVTSIVLAKPEGSEALYSPRIHVKLEVLRFSPALAGAHPRRLSNMEILGLLKRSAPASIGLRFINIPDAREALLAHAPHELSLDHDASPRKMTVSFGMDPGSYEKPNEGDGVTFAIAAIDANGARVQVYQRHLDPGRVPGDRGAQAATVEIPAGARRVLFSTQPGPRGNTAWDWSYWSAVGFD